MALRLPRIPRDVVLVEAPGRASAMFQRWWQSVVEKIESTVLDLEETIARVTTAETDLAALEAVTFTAGAGLTGGGNILTSPAFAVGAGTGIVVAADSVSVSAKLAAYDGGDTPSAFTLGIVDSADAAAWRTAIGAGTSSTTGTVTSVGMTVPTGFSVSGSPVTTSGTLALTYAAGYQGYTSTEATKLAGIETGATANNDLSSLDDYEEGTWSPTVTAGSGTITTLGTVTGTYTKIGRMVTAILNITITTNGTGATNIKATLPFTPAGPASVGAGRETDVTGTMLQAAVYAGAAEVVVNTYSNGYPGGSGYRLLLTVSYFV